MELNPYKKISFILLILSLNYSNNLEAQDTCLDRKYLMSLIYLKSSPELNSRIKSVFSHRVDTSQRFVEYNINDAISFLPLFYVLDGLTKEDAGDDSSLVYSRFDYIKKYQFTPFRNPLLKRLSIPNSSKLILTFSKPTKNYLLAEMLDSGNGSDGSFKNGKGLDFGFFFDDKGYIQKVLTAVGTYR